MQQTNSLPNSLRIVPMHVHTEPGASPRLILVTGGAPPRLTESSVCQRLVATARDAGGAICAPMGAIMAPFIAIAYAFAAWSLLANLRHNIVFLWPQGPLSNWLIWVAMALLLQFGSTRLSRVDRAVADRNSKGLEGFLTEMRIRNERVLLEGPRPGYQNREAA